MVAVPLLLSLLKRLLFNLCKKHFLYILSLATARGGGRRWRGLHENTDRRVRGEFCIVCNDEMKVKVVGTGEQVVPGAVDARGGERRARGAGHRRAVPGLRHARPAQHVLRDRHQRFARFTL